eukprot:gnl/MRDRNA2_/MRDRNA2_122023_c0_seq1.p1 gnl/MRDRNA2_/MRDRNA2_122023_c0~~gnl/MRDRNA2_/MRDRNA2_122023_c0_seq1.p1  ORF type:complete len:845 (+),score=125.16 gnl/MRDRNA2_/MRDRNA2_122023_c0_seq1:82-2616(+)
MSDETYTVKVEPAPAPPAEYEPSPPGDDPANGLNGKGASHNAGDNSDDQLGILQFSCALYYVKEGAEKELLIDVTRLGDASLPCSCSYKTIDGSAKAGKRYVACQGELSFKKGESMQQIAIPIIEDDQWDATLEFEVQLSEPKNANLGKYLFQCRVKVIDADCFPTNRFDTQLRPADLNHDVRLKSIQSTGFQLLIEYFKMNYGNKIVQKGSKKIAFYCQFSNFYMIWKLLLTKALIDRVLNKENWSDCADGEPRMVFHLFPCPDDQSSSTMYLYMFALLLVVPFILVHYHDYRKVHWKVGGASRKTLQANLLRKYLHYSPSARDTIKTSDLMMAMSHNSFELVSNGYMQLFPLISNIGRLFLVLFLQLYISFFGKKQQSPVMIALPMIVVVVFPIPLFAFLKVRNKKSTRTRRAENNAKNSLVDHVENTIRNFVLISDYQNRPKAVDDYEAKIGEYNGAATKAAAVSVNNKYFAPWVATLVTALWFVVGGNSVLSDGGITIGEFLTTMSIFGQVGKSWSGIYNIVLNMQDALVPMRTICLYLNLPTDLEQRMKINRERRAEGEEARNKLREAADSGVKFAADLIPIKISNLKYSYDSQLWKDELKLVDCDKQASTPSYGSLADCTLEIKQGEFIALIGLPGCGKSTLLRLLGGVLLGDEGYLLVPPHLRVLHVANDPLFFKGTLFENLIYGLKASDPDATHARAQKICTSLGVSPKIIEFLDPASKIEESWNEVLALTQRVLLNVARALMANPEILILHKPALVFDEDQAYNVFDILHQYVLNKGLHVEGNSQLRRPRTCIMSTSRVAGVQKADRVFRIEQGKVCETSKEEVTQYNKQRYALQ